MSCNYPVKCKFWGGEKKCTFDWENWDGKGHPCEQHQSVIDKQAEKEYFKAIDGGDKETAEAIRHSPFTNFGKRR